MNLYLISQDENGGYDTYDSAVVCADSERDASQIHPGINELWGDVHSSWASTPDNVKVELIGVADNNLEAESVICASFNAN